MKKFYRIKLYFVFSITLFISFCVSKVTLLTNDIELEVLDFNKYKAYEFELSSFNKNNFTHEFSYTVQSNDTLSVYLFSKKQYETWNDIMISLTDTQISSSLSSKENSTSPITIEQKILEKQKNKKNSIRHFHHIDCPVSHY